jgi:DNA-binding transcriptional ArsR family regulator
LLWIGHPYLDERTGVKSHYPVVSATEADRNHEGGTTAIGRTGDGVSAVSDVRDPDALADLLGDDCARTILVEAKKQPRSAAELSDRVGVSEPTVYRRLDRLREYDLVAEEIQPVTDGKNYKVYRTRLDGIELDLGEDGFEITVTRRERMADRFARFIEG